MRLHRAHGYIIPFTLFLSLFLVSLGYFMYSRFILSHTYETTLVKDYYARLAALEGLAFTAGQLSYNTAYTPSSDEKEAQNKVRATVDQEAQRFFSYLWPRLNTWQKITFPQTNPRTSMIYISSEEGKININNLYDFNQHKFRSEGTKAILKALFENIEKKTKEKNLFQDLENFLNQRSEKINDLRELLAIPSFHFFKERLFPPAHNDSSVLALYDIFSNESNKILLNPLLLSRACQNIFDIIPLQQEKKEKVINDITKKIKKLLMWNKDWDILLFPLYNKKFSDLPPTSQTFFDTIFEPKMFSVVSYGTFKSLTRGIFAIMERTSLVQNNRVLYTVSLKKVIWL